MDRILGVAIGIATVCLIFSILASHLQELWASFSARRAAALEIAIGNMLSDADLSKAFFDHPLIQSISFPSTRSAIFRGKTPGARRPSYISSDIFSRVLQSVLTTAHSLTERELPALIGALPESMVKHRMKTLTLGLESDARACNEAIEKWYDGTMDRINGLYKRNTQIVLLFLGLILAIACNANLLRVASTLWTSAAARDEVNAVAQMYGCKDDANCSADKYVEVRSDIEKNLKVLPVGYETLDLFEYWSTVAKGGQGVPIKEWIFNLGGWLLTAVAISLGAPFWFDLVNKFINIRMVGQKPPTAVDPKSSARSRT
jgi:hypothetical protein